MKVSEILQKAMQYYVITRDTPSVYMCHLLTDMADNELLTQDQARLAKAVIQQKVYPYVSLNAYLLGRPYYNKIYRLFGWQSMRRSHAYRVKWYKRWIKELARSGQ